MSNFHLARPERALKAKRSNTTTTDGFHDIEPGILLAHQVPLLPSSAPRAPAPADSQAPLQPHAPTRTTQAPVQMPAPHVWLPTPRSYTNFPGRERAIETVVSTREFRRRHWWLDAVKNTVLAMVGVAAAGAVVWVVVWKIAMHR